MVYSYNTVLRTLLTLANLLCNTHCVEYIRIPISGRIPIYTYDFLFRIVLCSEWYFVI